MHSDKHARLPDQPRAGSTPSAHLCALERLYPHICEEIVRRWGGEDIEAYLTNLIVATRHDRQGFPWEVISELIFLNDLVWQVNHDGMNAEVESHDAGDFTFSFSSNHHTGKPLTDCWVL